MCKIISGIWVIETPTSNPTYPPMLPTSVLKLRALKQVGYVDEKIIIRNVKDLIIDSTINIEIINKWYDSQ